MFDIHGQYRLLFGAAITVAIGFATAAVLDYKLMKDLKEQNQILSDELDRVESYISPAKTQVPLDKPDIEDLVQDQEDSMFPMEPPKVDYSKFHQESETPEEVNIFDEDKGEIFVIDFDEFGSTDIYELECLTFYANDLTLADDQDSIVDDADSTIGEDAYSRLITGSGWDGECLYVRNNKISVDYEIRYLKNSYKEMVASWQDE